MLKRKKRKKNPHSAALSYTQYGGKGGGGAGSAELLNLPERRSPAARRPRGDDVMAAIDAA